MMVCQTGAGKNWISFYILAQTLCCALLLDISNEVSAVPHVVSDVPHGFDPNWPEVYHILSTKCHGCHRPNTERTDLSSYETLMAARVDDDDDMRLVVPGDPESSLIWEYTAWNAASQVESDLADKPMMPPVRHEWLTEQQIDTLRQWINRGALEYVLPASCNIRPLLEIDFPSAKQCASCHPKQYDEWSRSMHAYAQQSPIFEAFNLTLIERTGGTLGTFCSRCHSPIGTALGENGSRRNVHRSRISLESVTCVACHRRSVGRYKSSGRVTVSPVVPGHLESACMYGPFDDSASHQVNAHQSQSLPYIKTSQFCGECHDVTSPTGVRLEEAFSEWQNSPAAKDRVTCQHCHMGPVQGVPIPDHHRPLGRAAVVPGWDPQRLPLRHLTDHTFAGPDYSVLPDTEFPHKLDWMYETDYRNPNHLTPYQLKTLTELRRRNRAQLAKADNKRYELLRNAARLEVRMPSFATQGQRCTIQASVVSTVAGHCFPTGFTAERQVWVSIEVRDPRGGVLFVSGDLDHNRDLRDEHSHDVLTGKFHHDKFLLNFQNKFIGLANKGTERSVLLSVNRDLQPINVLRPATGISASFGRPLSFRIAKGSIPPLGTVHRKYPIIFSAGAGIYSVDVRLNFRHLPPALLDHIGTPHLKHLLEIVVIDHHRSTIVVGET